MAEGTASGWTEGILLLIAFLVILGIVITNFNGLYNKDYQLGYGTNTTADEFINYQEDANNLIQSGEAETGGESGVSLGSSWGIVTGAVKIVWGFLTGGFIEQMAKSLNAGEAGLIFASYLRIVWFLSLVFAILYTLFKVIT